MEHSFESEVTESRLGVTMSIKIRPLLLRKSIYRCCFGHFNPYMCQTVILYSYCEIPALKSVNDSADVSWRIWENNILNKICKFGKNFNKHQNYRFLACWCMNICFLEGLQFKNTVTTQSLPQHSPPELLLSAIWYFRWIRFKDM